MASLCALAGESGSVLSQVENRWGGRLGSLGPVYKLPGKSWTTKQSYNIVTSWFISDGGGGAAAAAGGAAAAAGAAGGGGGGSDGGGGGSEKYLSSVETGIIVLQDH